MWSSLPPGLTLLAGALLLAVLRKPLRDLAAVAVPLLALLQVGLLAGAEAPAVSLPFLGYEVAPVQVHAPSTAFGVIFCLMAALGALFAANRDRRLESVGALVYAGGALGVIYAGDWLSLFAFWEIMTLGSTLVIWSARSVRSYGAGMRYFGLHALGGVILLAGIGWLLNLTGDASIGTIGFLTAGLEGGGAMASACALILIGMLINAGAYPLSAWIPDAYPAASETGTVWLSAYTTKTAVFTLLIAFAGSEVLIYLGLAMAIYGVVYAALENDIRRILAYSIVNQVGFMLCGIGVGTALAVDGVTAQAFAHILYKALLLMAAGAVIQATGRLTVRELGGLARHMPLTFAAAAVGVLAMSGLPLTTGATTKGMLTAAIAQAPADTDLTLIATAWFVIKAASVAIFLVAGLRFLWFVFLGRDCGLRPREAAPVGLVAMVILAVACLWIGLRPHELYALLPDPELAHATGLAEQGWSDVGGLSILLGVYLLLFMLVLPLLGCRRSLTLDVDWFYRRLIPALWHKGCLPVLRRAGRLQAAVMDGLPRSLSQRLRSEGGMTGLGLHREFSIGVTAVLVVLALLSVLLLEYLAV